MRRSVAAAVRCFGFGIFVAAAISSAQAGDRHAGYYYPEPATREGVAPRVRKKMEEVPVFE